MEEIQMIAQSISRPVLPTGTMIRRIVSRLLLLAAVTLGPMFAANAAVSVSVGIHVSSFPHLVLVPGYPVYYDPDLDSNYFFYDGEYWVYDGDTWYSSDWYDGPWVVVDRYYVPVFLLRVPVRYYRRPPAYFRAWVVDAPPRWGERWGHAWEERRRDWDRWDRNSVPRPAPLPAYQRQYSGSSYPHAPAQQQSIREEHYRYQPHEAITKQHFQEHVAPSHARVETSQHLDQQRHPNQGSPEQRSAQERTDRTPPPTQARQQTQQLAQPTSNMGHPASNNERREEEHRQQVVQQTGHPQSNRDRQPPERQAREESREPQHRPVSNAPKNEPQPRKDDEHGHDHHDDQHDDNRH
jgi:hypothetical protein